MTEHRPRDGQRNLADQPLPVSSGDSHGELPDDPDVGATRTRPLHLRLSALAWVFVGGIVGTALRYGTESLLPHDDSGWPWATFLINLAGAFVLGGLLEGLARLGDDSGWRQRARLCAGTGGCGAFTTYSTLALEVVLLGRAGHAATAISYGVSSVLGGVLTAWLGIVVAADVHRRRASS